MGFVLISSQDIEGITVVEIADWQGEISRLSHTGDKITIKAPRRARSEKWTFKRLGNGVLRVSSSRKDLAEVVPEGTSMVVLLPAAKRGSITVRKA